MTRRRIQSHDIIYFSLQFVISRLTSLIEYLSLNYQKFISIEIYGIFNFFAYIYFSRNIIATYNLYICLQNIITT